MDAERSWHAVVAKFQWVQVGTARQTVAQTPAEVTVTAAIWVPTNMRLALLQGVVVVGAVVAGVVAAPGAGAGGVPYLQHGQLTVQVQVLHALNGSLVCHWIRQERPQGNPTGRCTLEKERSLRILNRGSL